METSIVFLRAADRRPQSRVVHRSGAAIQTKKVPGTHAVKASGPGDIRNRPGRRCERGSESRASPGVRQRHIAVSSDDHGQGVVERMRKRIARRAMTEIRMEIADIRVTGEILR